MMETTISPQVFRLAQIISALPDSYKAESTAEARQDCLRVLADLDITEPHTLDQSTIITLLVHNRVNARGCRYVWNWYSNRLNIVRDPDGLNDDNSFSTSLTS